MVGKRNCTTIEPSKTLLSVVLPGGAPVTLFAVSTTSFRNSIIVLGSESRENGAFMANCTLLNFVGGSVVGAIVVVAGTVVVVVVLGTVVVVVVAGTGITAEEGRDALVFQVPRRATVSKV